jgi:hypothetical protein
LNAVAAALWLLGIGYAGSALRSNGRASIADRVRDALVIGVAIPTGLALVDMLYPATCWVALAIVVAIAYIRRPRNLANDIAEPVPYILAAAVFFVAWPQLMRPPLDGDTLSYHLPNAAAWVHAHSMWTTDGRYWWYPPASEAFAAGLYAVSGPFAIAWAGFGALALLGLRLATWLRERCGATPLLADIIAAAAVTAAPLSQQAGSLQNDVWLGAFFLESLWTMLYEPVAATRTAIVTALIKPYGWVLALIAAATTRAARGVWIAIGASALLWFGHDALLWHHALVPPAETSYANTWNSTILANGFGALALLVRVSFTVSPFFALALLAAFAGPFLDREPRRAIGYSAFAAALFFLVMPLAFVDVRPELASGASLRYAVPAIVAGVVAAGPLIARFSIVSLIVSGLSCIFGVATTSEIYWNDGGTRTALAVGPLAALSAYLAQRQKILATASVIAFALSVVAAAYLAGRHPVDYYADTYAVGGKPSQLFAWIERTQPSSTGGWGIRIGVVDVLAPHARTLDLPESHPCTTARAANVSLVALAEQDRSPWYNEQRLRVARACGYVTFHDPLAVVSGFSP